MTKKALWLVVSGLMALTIAAAACTTPAATTPPPASTPTPAATTAPPLITPTPTTTVAPTPTPQPVPGTGAKSGTPLYGGTLTTTGASDPTSWGPFPGSGSTPITLQELWAGDWTLGNAGGYGQGITDYAQNLERFDRKAALIAEKTTWSVDPATNVATIDYIIRQGIHYYQVPGSAASQLVNGRELTADDAVFVMQQRLTDLTSYVRLTNPELSTANITKIGPREITVSLAAPNLLTALHDLSGVCGYYPPEVFKNFNKMTSWKDQVGTSAWMLTDYVPGSLITYSKNPTYWEKDPVGPGKGNQLPYISKRVTIIIPDSSTRIAALRTGKVDLASSMLPDDALPLLKGVPALKSLTKTSVDGRGTPIFMRVDQAPFTDARVRQAMVYAIDYNNILQSYWGGKGQILTYPYADTTDYHDMYLGLNDPDTPPEIKDMFTYNPDKAKQLLKDAGFPTGFKTSLMLSATDQAGIDYYSIIKNMWSKVGIDLSFDLATSATYSNRQASRDFAMTTGTTAPASSFYLGVAFQGTGQISNLGNLNDPVVNAALADARAAAITDTAKAMKVYRNELAKYVVAQAFAIPNVIGYNYNVWWPWLANYSGEGPVSFAQTTWPNYVWIDQNLKKSMGY